MVKLFDYFKRNHYGSEIEMPNELERVSRMVEELQSKVTIIETRFDSHETDCIRSARELREDFKDWRLEMKEWRAGLGVRLDSQDKLMRSSLIGVITISLSIIGYLVSKLWH